MSTLLDDDTIVLEQLDFDVSCVHCDGKADVYVKCRGCESNAGNLCADHLVKMQAYIEMLILGFMIPRCRSCLRLATSFGSAYQVVPL